ncbi:MAG TPA: clan AA aspartic protease [Phycisphaerae bacterium]
MIAGSVLPDGQPMVTVLVRGPTRQVARVQAAIDTGFNDYLALPPSAIERLGLESEDEGKYVLADGSESPMDIYRAEIEWMGAWRSILVISLDANVLLGTAMMHGCVLTIEMLDGGRVEIRPINS